MKVECDERGHESCACAKDLGAAWEYAGQKLVHILFSCSPAEYQEALSAPRADVQWCQNAAQ